MLACCKCCELPQAKVADKVGAIPQEDKKIEADEDQTILTLVTLTLASYPHSERKS